MWTAASQRTDAALRWVALLALLALPAGPLRAQSEAEEAADPTVLVSPERAELFVALLRRRAQELLERRRREPAFTINASSSLTQGYESNVALDGQRKGDHFTQETLGVVVSQRLAPWLRVRGAYDLFNNHYTERRDFNIWMNTLGATLQWLPHQRARLEAGYEYSIVNFPFDTANSFFDQRTSLSALLAITRWMVHRAGWTYQLRHFDTREARDDLAVNIPSVVREDQRQALQYEIRCYFPKTSGTLLAEYYRNTSNEQFQDFYDWDNYQARGVVSHHLTDRLLGITSVGYERREYHARQVPAINEAERDHLYTLAGSVVYQLGARWQGRYSLIYRYQDSNDPRLDFTDWINEAGLSVKF